MNVEGNLEKARKRLLLIRGYAEAIGNILSEVMKCSDDCTDPLYLGINGLIDEIIDEAEIALQEINEEIEMKYRFEEQKENES